MHFELTNDLSLYFLSEDYQYQSIFHIEGQHEKCSSLKNVLELLSPLKIDLNISTISKTIKIEIFIKGNQNNYKGNNKNTISVIQRNNRSGIVCSRSNKVVYLIMRILKNEKEKW